MKANVYFLKNPINQEIFYIGATTKQISIRLKSHYAHLREASKGKRQFNKRLEYLLNLMPHKAEIHLIENVDEYLMDSTEIMYIGLFRSWGFNLTNQTDGGQGGNTYKSMTQVRKDLYKLKLQNSLKGKKKPEGFAENLSKTRMGINNPAAGKSKNYPIAAYKENVLEKIFYYAFEIDEFVGIKGSAGNIIKSINNKKGSPYGYTWKQYKI